jgi:hypothetical protein
MYYKDFTCPFFIYCGDTWIHIFYFLGIKVFAEGCRKKVLNRRFGCSKTDKNGNARRSDHDGDRCSTFSS